MDLDSRLSLMDIRDIAGSKINYERGEEYFIRHKVTSVKLWKTEGEEQLAASVNGNGDAPYSTSVYIDETGQLMDYDCSCPAFLDNVRVCKHIVALLLYRFSRKEKSAYKIMKEPGPFDYEDDDDYDNDFERDIITKEDYDRIINNLVHERGGTDKNVSTDMHIKSLINHYIIDDLARVSAENNVQAVPKLEFYQGVAFLNITVGISRQYVVKNIESFCSSMAAGEIVKYGKELELAHHIDSFEPESQPLINFILRKQQEKAYYTPFRNKYAGAYGYSYGSSTYGPESEKKNIKLTPSGMDELFDLLVGREFMVGDCKSVKILNGKPPYYLEIKEISGQKGFSLTFPDCDYILGDKYIYLYCNERSRFGKEHNLTNVLYRCSQEFSSQMKNLITARLSSPLPLRISDKDMTSFYVNVLSELKNIVEIRGDISRLKKFTPDEMQAKIYLDSPQNDAVTAVVKYQYKNTEIDPYDNSQKPPENIARDEKKERRVSLVVNQYFKHYDQRMKFLFIQGENDLLYQFITEGFSEISNVGQVFVSDRFKNMSVKRPPQITVGVRLESDLLHIDLDTKELPLNEAMDALEQYRQKRKYYRLKDGSFLKLEDAGFSELAEMVEGLGLSRKDLSNGEITVPKYRALHLDYLLKNSEYMTFERNGRFKSLIKNVKSIDDSEFTVPEQLDSIMRGYQKDGFHWLTIMNSYGFGGILADDMGLGKTLQMISLLLSKKEEGQDCSTLVVCPASLVLNWQNEIQKFAPRLNVLTAIGSLAERKVLLEQMDNSDVILTSFDLLKRDIDHYLGKEFSYHIVDEAQFIKNHGTQNAKAVKAIKSRQRFALTGTPIENRLSELWSIFDFLMPGYLFSYNKFKEIYESDIVKNGDKDKAAMLSRQVAPFMLRRLKKNVLKELPEKIESVMYAQMEGEQKKLYLANLAKATAKINDKIKEGGFESNKLMILALLTRLRQICCHPSLCYEDYRGESAKLETCIELLLEAASGGHKVLLFSQFTSMLEIIEKRLEKEELSYYILTGATAKEKRMELVDRFNKDDTQVFLISLKAGGTGLNLTAADVVIHYDPWWNVAAQNQATDRTHRIGQKNSVQVYKLIEKGTLEEKILKLQESKKDLADSVVQDETAGFQALTQDALLELLR